MARTADALLEEQILKAARSLLGTKGPAALNLRAVARAAGTTTPTLYTRFRSKKALLVAIGLRVRDQINEAMFRASSLEEACRNYLDYAEQHPHDYDLARTVWPEVIGSGRPRPGRAWLLARIAERFGGEAEDYAEAFYAILFLLHGTATLLTIADDPISAKEMRDHCLVVCESLIRNVKILRRS